MAIWILYSSIFFMYYKFGILIFTYLSTIINGIFFFIKMLRSFF